MIRIPLDVPRRANDVSDFVGLDADRVSPPLVERFARVDAFLVVDVGVDFTVNVFFVLAMYGLLQYVVYSDHNAFPLHSSGVQVEHDSVFK